ncbi:MAG: PspC domain-containing protein [Candidatus Cloacimonadota bacterium]|nr:PspC domain-containing protein [Candidatus Cloacimonadota bacterium]
MKVKKTLYRDLKNNKIGGVCAGLAEYFGLDVSLVRIIWILLVLIFGTGILVYLVAWIIIPPKPEKFYGIEIIDDEEEKEGIHLSRDNRMIFGVCGGIAEYYDFDASIIRIIFLILILTFGFGFLVYILLALILSYKPEDKEGKIDEE